MTEEADILKQRKISVKAAARMMGISTSLVYKLISSREIHYYRIKNKITIPADEIRKYMLTHFHD